jgi:fused signal recognition particle receptor
MTTTWIIAAIGFTVGMTLLIWWLAVRKRRSTTATLPLTTTSELPLAVTPSPSRKPPPTPVVAPRLSPDAERMQAALARSRAGFMGTLAGLLQRKPGQRLAIDQSVERELETTLLAADLGAATTAKLLERIRTRSSEDGDLWEALKKDVQAMLQRGVVASKPPNKPEVWLVVGVNGVGKTTTVAKLAQQRMSQGNKVVVGAADTFRAAAVAQLQAWGHRIGCEVVSGKTDADPGSVAFDTIRRAQQLQADVALIDTAGRLHTKTSLMEELKKVNRTCEKALGRPVDEILLVLDATSGQNALQQAATFQQALPLTGLVLTKLDGTAKGGVVLAVCDQLGLAVRFVGIGEGMDDLEEFDAQAFADALFNISPTH